jgi:hypothetical protein
MTLLTPDQYISDLPGIDGFKHPTLHFVLIYFYFALFFLTVCNNTEGGQRTCHAFSMGREMFHRNGSRTLH